jgi:hypothetical protein
MTCRVLNLFSHDGKDDAQECKHGHCYCLKWGLARLHEGTALARGVEAASEQGKGWGGVVVDLVKRERGRGEGGQRSREGFPVGGDGSTGSPFLNLYIQPSIPPPPTHTHIHSHKYTDSLTHTHKHTNTHTQLVQHRGQALERAALELKGVGEHGCVCQHHCGPVRQQLNHLLWPSLFWVRFGLVWFGRVVGCWLLLLE